MKHSAPRRASKGQLGLFRAAEPQAHSPASLEDPATLAVEIAADLRSAEPAIGELAAELSGASPRAPSMVDRIQEVMRRQTARAERELAELRGLHAELLGVPVAELDQHVAAACQPARRAQPAATARPRRRRSGAQAESEAPKAPPTARLTERQRELVRGFEVRDNVARYTGQDRVPDWAAVKAVFIALGARWRTGRPGGFHFRDEDDGAELVRLALATGEILDPRAAGFFPTPADLAADLVQRAGVGPGDLVLEPSAGRGAIAAAARAGGAKVSCVELLPGNAAALRQQGFDVHEGDFLALAPRAEFTAVVMNPPFGERQDIAHIRHAARFLAPGGRLVSVASAGVRYREDQFARAFRGWVAEQGGSIEDLPEGAFLESGTGVRTCTVTLRP